MDAEDPKPQVMYDADGKLRPLPKNKGGRPRGSTKYKPTWRERHLVIGHLVTGGKLEDIPGLIFHCKPDAPKLTLDMAKYVFREEIKNGVNLWKAENASATHEKVVAGDLQAAKLESQYLYPSEEERRNIRTDTTPANLPPIRFVGPNLADNADLIDITPKALPHYGPTQEPAGGTPVRQPLKPVNDYPDDRVTVPRSKMPYQYRKNDDPFLTGGMELWGDMDRPTPGNKRK